MRHLKLAGMLAIAAAAWDCARSEGTTVVAAGSDRIPLRMRAIGDSVWELSLKGPEGESHLRVRPHVRAVPDNAPFVTTTWTLYSVQGSSPRALLAALARAHDMPDTVRLASAIDSLQLDVALLGINCRRNSAGAFGANGTGTWMAAKLFFADDEGEVYLNLSPATSEAELGVKDEQYGPAVSRALGRLRSSPDRQSSNDR